MTDRLQEIYEMRAQYGGIIHEEHVAWLIAEVERLRAERPVEFYKRLDEENERLRTKVEELEEFWSYKEGSSDD